MRSRTIILLTLIILVVGFLAYWIEIAFPGTPSVYSTYTTLSQPAPSSVGSYDVLGHVVSKAEAASWLQTEEGRKQLAPENGAVEVTEELIDLGRKAFYTETFGNEVFLTDVAGIIDGPINLRNLTKAILALGGKQTSNLQVPLERDVTIGGRTFKAGTLLNTGLDVPARSLVPLGMRVHLGNGKIRVGITCASCHAAVDENTGRILEGAPNKDLNTGLLLAFATNSASWFRQTGVNPTKIPVGQHKYINAERQVAYLPEAKALEDAVDAQLLAWPPGNFDSTGDNRNNPSQNPSSYTHEAWPYGWSGNAAIGWFHGLTTLNSNVHGTNSDQTAGADASQQLLGIDKETYLGVILQNSANPAFRLPKKPRQPSRVLKKIDPTPRSPAMNEVIQMPGYPKGSPFILDGLMANSPGMPVAAQINGMSAFQNTLAPPPYPTGDTAALQRGAAVFSRAGCVYCHSGRYFTNHDVVAETEIGSQPSRARAQAAFARNFVAPETYPSNLRVPLPRKPPTLPVPTDITPQKAQNLAFAIGNPSGGYKVPSLIGLHVTAPYLHDGGVAAGSQALKAQKKRYKVADRNQLGLAGTLMRGIPADPNASLRVLLDRELRQPTIAANKANANLRESNADGSGHRYWVDAKAGYSLQEQNDLIQFLLSLDDDPEVLPREVAQK